MADKTRTIMTTLVEPKDADVLSVYVHRKEYVQYEYKLMTDSGAVHETKSMPPIPYDSLSPEQQACIDMLVQMCAEDLKAKRGPFA